METKDISMGATAMIIANQGSRIKQLEQQLKEAREVIEFYAHDYMFKRSEKEFPNFGASAREYLTKYKVKE